MISIVMPAYNAGHFIGEAVQSVIDQTYRSWELLVIDDCSTDNTEEILVPYLQLIPQIRYYKNKENLGVAESRNRGVMLAKGEWVAFLDSDDCWHPEKLKQQMELAEARKAEFLFTGSGFLNEEGKMLDYILSVPETVGYRELLKQNIISCSSVLIRKELMEEYPMKHASRMHEDFAVWLLILREKKLQAYGVNQPLLLYRVRAQSKSGNKRKAAVMTFNVYRYLGLSFLEASYYWGCYCVRSLRKYKHLL